MTTTKPRITRVRSGRWWQITWTTEGVERSAWTRTWPHALERALKIAARSTP